MTECHVFIAGFYWGVLISNLFHHANKGGFNTIISWDFVYTVWLWNSESDVIFMSDSRVCRLALAFEIYNVLLLEKIYIYMQLKLNGNQSSARVFKGFKPFQKTMKKTHARDALIHQRWTNILKKLVIW